MACDLILNMPEKRYQSWGRFPKAEQAALRYDWRSDPLPLSRIESRTFLPFGNGRSYGDVCLNEGGVLLDCRGLNKFLSFDSDSGVLRCEAGVLLSEILQLIVPGGWFLPVTPGTKFVSLGGAIAKRAQAFGMKVIAFDPILTQLKAEALGVELVSLDELIERSDFITVHAPKNLDTDNMIRAEHFKRMIKAAH